MTLAKDDKSGFARVSTPVKALAVSAIGLLLSAGLCGIGFWNDRSVHDGAPSTFDILGGLSFVVFALGFVVSIGAIVLAAIFGALRRDR
jgi:hypothetical protein